MNAAAVILLVGIIFVIAYRIYAKKIEDIWQIDPKRPTPSATKFDGVDYVPAKNSLVLFGHHFASIAGAGPIIGPVIACTIWGWVPAMIWIVLGSIFIGGIHDFGSLITSIREEGMSIGDIAQKSVSRKAKIIFSIFLWFALILVIAVFAHFGASIFITQPKVVIPSLGIIPLAIIVGLALYRWRWNATQVTIGGLIALGGLIVLGNHWPVVVGDNGQMIWLAVLLIYAFFASITPVHILLQPRDYLSSFLLFGGITLGLLGILVSHPNMNGPAFIQTKSFTEALWPLMFITVACGANSGFHSLISSGTTSKQIVSETQAKRIGFGGMLMEGFLASLVIVIIISGFSATEFQSHIVNKTQPVTIYGSGFGNITAPILGPWGHFIGLMILNVFILTTLDSATRITRYITEELSGIKNRLLSTLLVVASAGIFVIGKDSAQIPIWKKIWPIFGASNQLVAALTLLVISCWLLSKGKPTLYSLLPAFFMLITSISSLLIKMVQFAQNGDYLLTTISVILIGSAIYLVKEVGLTIKRIKKT